MFSPASSLMPSDPESLPSHSTTNISRLIRSWGWDRAVDAGPVGRPEPGSARCRSCGGRERCHGGAEAAAPGERDPSAGAGHPEEGHRFFRPGGKSMRFALIDGAKAQFPVHRLCRVLGVSQSGYFAWRGRSACRRQREDMVLLAHVRSAFAVSHGTYGSPRMTRELRDSGLVVGRRRIARLMRDNGLQARQKRRFKRTTDSQHAWPVAPNLLDQDFTATAPDKKWGADISYVWTREGWLYLAVVIDLFARRVVGWATGDRLHRDLALAAVRKALTMRRPAAGLIHHSDRGSQGGFKRSSQHLEKGLRWALGSGARIRPGEVSCGRRVGQGWRGVRIGGGSGRRSRRAWRVRTPRAVRVYRRR